MKVKQPTLKEEQDRAEEDRKLLELLSRGKAETQYVPQACRKQKEERDA